MTLRVSVIGTNYMGATHAAGMAEFGHQVIGVDIDVDRVKTLNAGQAHIFEVGLEPLLERHTASGGCGSLPTTPRLRIGPMCISWRWAPRLVPAVPLT